mgnify:FL=1
MSRRALLLGATGLVGARVLDRLLADDRWQQLVVISRRPLAIRHDKLRVIECSLEQLDTLGAEFAVDDVFCCLGTTMKQAGSRAAFARVDHDYCVTAARLARDAGAPRFLMVSAVNANSNGVSFYARTKGRAEQDVAALGIPLTVFMQPSLLQGERQQQRLAEEAGLRVMGALLPLVRWSGAAWLPVQASRVADAMVAVALFGPDTGLWRLRYRQIENYAQQLR